MSEKYFHVLMENYKNPEKGRLGVSVDVWANIINHSGQSDADIMAILYERDVEHEEIREIQYGFNMQAEAYISLMEENKRLQDAYNTLEFISKYDGKDNNRRNWNEEFIFIKVKAMDCIDRIKKVKSVLNGENDE